MICDTQAVEAAGCNALEDAQMTRVRKRRVEA